jgi:Domain of unknown function (DUF4873)
VIHDVIVVGADLPGFASLDRDVISSVFDDDTDTWTLTTADGQTRARVVITGKPPLVPWIPDIFGRREFRGRCFHAAAPPADFDAAGRRIAVIGGDASAGQLIEQLGSAAAVKVFPLPPRRVIRPLRRARRYPRHRRPRVVASPLNEVTAAGVRTADGVHHDADVIVYGTGFAVRAGTAPETLVGRGGQTIQQIWTNGAEPYLGIALHGVPNYFISTGPVLQCLALLNGYSRIEVRRSAQQVFNERVHLRAARLQPSAFDVTSDDVGGVDGDTYDGPATLTGADACEQVRVRLTGHIDPIDGQYHWQGTIFGQLPAPLPKTVTVAVGERSAPARITEQTSQGTHSIAGVGAPPFALSVEHPARVV